MKWPRKIDVSFWGDGDGDYSLFPIDDELRKFFDEYAVTVARIPLEEVKFHVDDAIDVVERLSAEDVSSEWITQSIKNSGEVTFRSDPVLVMREYVLHIEQMDSEDDEDVKE